MTLLATTVVKLALLVHLDAHAVEFEKLGTAVAKALGTKKAFRTTVSIGGDEVPVFYAKGAGGHPTRYAVVQKRVYPPNCSHTWVVGVEPSGTITDVRVVEMKCPHAFPAQKASFLEQYRGKGPADVKTLKSDIHGIAKATGTCELTSDAVKTSIDAVLKSRDGV